MMRFKLTTDGFDDDGLLLAQLSVNGTAYASTSAKNYKAAVKWAETLAADYKADHTPETTETFERNFSL